MFRDVDADLRGNAFYATNVRQNFRVCTDHHDGQCRDDAARPQRRAAFGDVLP
jgi:hypothetical protein